MVRLDMALLGKAQLNAAVSNGDVSISVGTTAELPDDIPFRVILAAKRTDLLTEDIEVVEVGSVDETENNLDNCTRGLEGTSAQDWDSGDYVENRATPELLNQISQALYDSNLAKILGNADGNIQTLTNIEDDQGNTIFDYANQKIPDAILDYFSQDDIENIIAGLLEEGDNVTLTYDDGTLTIDVEDEGLTESEIDTLLTEGDGIDTTYDSGAGTLTIEVDESEISHDNISGKSPDDHHEKTTSEDVNHDETEGGTDSNAHHSKTDSASEIDDVSPDSDSDAHHDPYSDSEAVGATDGVIDAESVDGYDIQKDGAGGTGIINFLT